MAIVNKQCQKRWSSHRGRVLGCRLLTVGAGLFLRLILRASSCRLLMTLLAVEETRATGREATWRTGTLLREGTGGGGRVGTASEGAGFGCIGFG